MEVFMMNPDFESMSIRQLQAHLLEHRTDTKAFYLLMDKIRAQPNPVWYKDEDMNRFPEIYAEYLKRRSEQSD
jgi:hypothetical protein